MQQFFGTQNQSHDLLNISVHNYSVYAVTSILTKGLTELFAVAREIIQPIWKIFRFEDLL